MSELAIKRLSVLSALTLMLLLAVSPAIATNEGIPPSLMLATPSWYTDDLHEQVLASGQRGVDVPLSMIRASEQATDINCLGTSPPFVSTSGASINAVSAGGCMVHPAGCSMNFIFYDGRSYYIGTAGHCLAGGGNVVMQVATRVDPTNTVLVTLASIGRVAKKVNSGIGRDFGLAKIDPGWGVMPGVAGAAGPTGIFCGDPLGQPVVHYGHGYVFAVEQGHPKVGEVIPDLDLLVKFASTEHGYNWVGYGLPGDSGSPVMNDAGLVVGNLTHGLGVDFVPIPGLSFGTTTAGMFSIIGSGFTLVTAAGRTVNCANALGGVVAI